MIPVIAERGTCFAGAFAYYCHDKRARTRNRVAWTHTVNLLTDCVDVGCQRMIRTVKHQNVLKRRSGQHATGAKLKKPVFSYSLSWHPEQRPTQAAMLEAAHDTLRCLGLTEHQTVIVAHNEKPHEHLHLIVNLAHPVTGLVAKLKYTKRKLSEFALNYERKEGKMYCPAREKNHVRRKQGHSTKHGDPILTEAWHGTVNGMDFIEKLKSKGYCLAKGRRLVVVTAQGKVLNPARELGIRVKEFSEQFGEVDLPGLSEVLAKQKGNSAPENQNGLEQRQADQKARLLEQHSRSMARTRQGLTNRFQLATKVSQISVLERKLLRSGILQRLFGLQAHRRRALRKLQQEVDVATEHIELTLEVMREENEVALQELENRQRQERLATS